MDDNVSQRPSIRLRRIPSSATLNQSIEQQDFPDNGNLQVPGGPGTPGGQSLVGRPRSTSAASRLGRRLSGYMPHIGEGEQTPQTQPENPERPATGRSASAIRRKPLPDLPEGAPVSDGSEEYEANLVDLLDLVGMLHRLQLRKHLLTATRSRSSNTTDPYERAEFAFRSRSGTLYQQATIIYAYASTI
jgi:hypothetical protein